MCAFCSRRVRPREERLIKRINSDKVKESQLAVHIMYNVDAHLVLVTTHEGPGLQLEPFSSVSLSGLVCDLICCVASVIHIAISCFALLTTFFFVYSP